MPLGTWLLKVVAQQSLAQGVIYEQWLGAAGPVHVVRVAAEAARGVRPIVASRGRAPLLRLAAGGVAGINGGYFDPQTAAPVSWVLADGRTVSDPRRNHRLMTNPVLQPFLPSIQRRTEWRVLQGPAGWRWQVAPHGSETPVGWTLRHALQAGPRLLPTAGLTGEAFLRPGRDAINAQGRSARSGLGLTGKGELLLAMSPSGQPLATFRETLRRLGCVEAMALDGGSSSQLVWKDARGWHIVGPGSAKGPTKGQRPDILSAIVVGR
jgi:hypothetical protein